MNMNNYELQLSKPDAKLYSYGSTKPLPAAGMALSSIYTNRTGKEVDTKFM